MRAGASAWPTSARVNTRPRSGRFAACSLKPVREGLGQATHVQAQAPSAAEVTQESYLGAEKAERFENGTLREGLHDYGSGAAPAREHLRYEGSWRVGRGIRRSRRTAPG